MMRNDMYRNKKSRKGQFALEFMMTYGWAILVVLTIISALIYFTPNIKTITGKRCTFGPATPCIGMTLDNSDLTIVLRNSILQKMYNVRAEVTFPTPTPLPVPCDIYDFDNNPTTTINTDQRFIVRCNNVAATGGLGLTDDSSVRITVKYQKSSTGFDQISEGDIYAKMQRS